MKRIILFIVSIFVFLSCNQHKVVERTKLSIGTQFFATHAPLKGRVKEMHERNYWAKEESGKVTKGVPLTWNEIDSIKTFRNSNCYFDETGTPLMEEYVDENNIVKRAQVFKLDKGRWVKCEILRDGKIEVYFIPDYNSAGLFSDAKYFRAENDTLLTRSAFYYDNKGNPNKFEAYNARGIKTRSIVIDYDSQGQVSEVRGLNQKDSVSSKRKITYDSKGFISSQVIETIKPATTEIWKYTPLQWDTHGNCTLYLQNVDNGKFMFVTERNLVYY